MNAEQILNREFLEIRCRILDLAASLDRLDRSEGSVSQDPRMDQLRRGLELLLAPSDQRAEQVQLLFSRAYTPHWREQLGVSG
jgi:hypothetical protein